ncbi:MAG: P-II family nitrogen regulator [Anaerolineae bacterium]
MAYLLIAIINDLAKCHEVLSAWEEAGVSGVTILESTGLGRIKAAARDDLPLIPSLRDLLTAHEFHHRTIFTVVEDEETMERLAEITQRVVGDFSQPDTGLMFAVPAAKVWGLRKMGRAGQKK